MDKTKALSIDMLTVLEIRLNTFRTSHYKPLKDTLYWKKVTQFSRHEGGTSHDVSLLSAASPTCWEIVINSMLEKQFIIEEEAGMIRLELFG